MPAHGRVTVTEVADTGTWTATAAATAAAPPGAVPQTDTGSEDGVAAAVSGADVFAASPSRTVCGNDQLMTPEILPITNQP